MEISAEELMKVLSGGAQASLETPDEDAKEETLLTDLAAAIFDLNQKVDMLLAEDVAENELYMGGMSSSAKGNAPMPFNYDGSLAPITYNTPINYGG